MYTVKMTQNLVKLSQKSCSDLFEPEACMRCSFAIHELKAFPDVPAATDTVPISMDSY